MREKPDKGCKKCRNPFATHKAKHPAHAWCMAGCCPGAGAVSLVTLGMVPAKQPARLHHRRRTQPSATPLMPLAVQPRSAEQLGVPVHQTGHASSVGFALARTAPAPLGHRLCSALPEQAIPAHSWAAPAQTTARPAAHCAAVPCPPAQGAAAPALHPWRRTTVAACAAGYPMERQWSACFWAWGWCWYQTDCP